MWVVEIVVTLESLSFISQVKASRSLVWPQNALQAISIQILSHHTLSLLFDVDTFAQNKKSCFVCEKKNNISPGSFGEIFPATISPTEGEKSLNYAWRAREIIFHNFIYSTLSLVVGARVTMLFYFNHDRAWIIENNMTQRRVP